MLITIASQSLPVRTMLLKFDSSVINETFLILFYERQNDVTNEVASTRSIQIIHRYP